MLSHIDWSMDAGPIWLVGFTLGFLTVVAIGYWHEKKGGK